MGWNRLTNLTRRSLLIWTADMRGQGWKIPLVHLPSQVNIGQDDMNPDLLTEVTYGEHGFAPMMEKSGTGRMSPVRGRTMKEYDQQLADLKKENFNLKLRIYFMEERMNTKYNEEDVIKTNIELKVEVESYKKDIQEKTALLEKASETIDTLTSKYSDELEKEVINIKKACDEKVQQADQTIAELQEEVRLLDERLREGEDEWQKDNNKLMEQTKELEALKDCIQEKNDKIMGLTRQVQTSEQQIKEMKFDSRKQQDDLQEELDNLSKNLGRKDRDIQRLSIIVKDKTSIEGVTALERSHLKDAMEDTKRNLEKMTKKCDEQECGLGRQKQMIGKLEDLLRTKEKEKQEVKQALKERNEVYKSAKETIIQLVSDLHHKTEEAKELSDILEGVRDELNKTRNQLYLADKDKKKEADKVEELQENCERLARTLGKKEGELEGFRDLLQKAEQSLCISQTAVESLEKQLEKERCRCQKKVHEETDDQKEETMKLRRELDNLHAQLQERERMYESKCKELDTVASRLDITVETKSNTGDKSDMLQHILDELKVLKGAVETDRHLHIDINSSHSVQDGGPYTRDGDIQRTPTSQQNKRTSHHSVNHSTSRIPVRRGSSTSSAADDLENLRTQVTDLTARNRNLQNMLQATEETVHCQTQKMKHYRNMLIDFGHLTGNMSRSNSVPNLAKLPLSPMLETTEGPGRSRQRSADNLPTLRGRSMSPTPGRMCRGETGNELEKLLMENSKLKQHVDGYKRVLKVFQGRSPSPESDATGESGQDGGPTPISSDSASCLLENWLDMVDKFLMELSQGDQNGHTAAVTSTTEVSRIRRGLVQAREAIQSISSTSLAPEVRNTGDGGRLSPDSGCSDHNPASVQNIDSPTRNNKSPRTSPGGKNSPSSPRISPNTSPKTSPQTSPLNMTGSLHDSGADPSRFSRDFSQTGSHHSVEILRKCPPGNMSTQSMTGDNIFGSSPYGSKLRTGDRKKHDIVNIPLERLRSGNLRALSNNRNAGSQFNDTMFNHTFSQSMIADTTVSDLNMTDGAWATNDSINMTSANNAELQLHIQSLEEIIRSHEEQIRQHSHPNLDSLQQQLMELRNLRIQLERSMKINDNLAQQLQELHWTSASSMLDLKQQIEDLHSRLAKSNDNLSEKVKIISEKERVIKETDLSVIKLRDSFARDNADLDMYKEKVKSLDLELNESRQSCDQLTNMCQQLKVVLEQYKRRCEQLENDNRQHVEAVDRYQSRASDLELEMSSKLHNVHKVNAENENLRTRVQELEGDANQFQENEAKYKQLLAQSRSHVNKVVGDIDTLKSELKRQTDVLEKAKSELQLSNKTIEEQDRHLYQKDSLIEKISSDLDGRNTLIHKQETVIEDVNKGLDQQKRMCADYKRQIEKQNQLTRDLRERADKLGEELSQSLHSRDTVIIEKQKELEETTRRGDKYLSNLKVTLNECLKYKKNWRELQKKYDDLGAINRTLKMELGVREKLMEAQGNGLTDDAKQNMIVELLNELKYARIQMTKILEQNDSISSKLADLVQERQKELSGREYHPERDQKPNLQSHRHRVEVNMSHTEENIEFHTSFGGNQTWPTYGDLITGLPRTDNMSTSLPLREGTLGRSSTQAAGMSSNLPSGKRPDTSRPLLSDSLRDISSPGVPLEGAQDQNDSMNQFYEKKTTLSSSFEKASKNLPSSGVSTNQSDLLSSGSHFSIPGPIYKQRVTDECLLYNVNDSPQYLAGLTQVRIDSDIRSLFAVGMIDHFEKLRKETNECQALLRGLNTRIAERLKTLSKMSATESMEYSTLKEMSFTADHLRICVDSQMSAIGCFWTSELPAPNEKGEFVNQKLQDKNSHLQDELSALMGRYEHLSKKSTKEFQKTNSDHLLCEEQVCESLESTIDVLTRANHNFQNNHQSTHHSPHRSPPRRSPRK